MKGESKRYRSSKLSLIRTNRKIKSLLVFKFREEGLLNRDVIRDAKDFGYNISEASLSKYINKEEITTGSLTEKDVVFLCARWGVDINIESSLNSMDKDVIKNNLLTHFPELEENIKSYFNE